MERSRITLNVALVFAFTLRIARALAARIGRYCGLLLLLFLSSQLVTACGTSEIFSGGTMSSPGRFPEGRPLRPEDRIAFVPATREVESFVTCVLDGLEGRMAPARLVPPREAYRLASATGAVESDVLPDVLESEARARLAASGIRYVTVISGQTSASPYEVEASHDNTYTWWFLHERRSNFFADVYDTASGELVTGAGAHSKGEGGVFFLFIIVPVPIFAPTEWEACRAMRDALLKTLALPETGEEP